MRTSVSFRRPGARTAVIVLVLLLGPNPATAQAPTYAPANRPATTSSEPARTPIQRRTDPAPVTARSPASPWGTFALLGGIVALILLGGRWLRRAAPHRFGGLAPAAVDLLGSCPITPHTALHVVRVGERLLVLGSGSDGLRTLMEVSDRAEAAHLMHLCREQATQRSEWNPWRFFGRQEHAPGSIPPVLPPESTDTASLELPARRRPLQNVVRAGLWVMMSSGLTGCSLSAQTADALPPREPPSRQTAWRDAARSDAAQQSQLLPTWTGEPPASFIPTDITAPARPADDATHNSASPLSPPAFESGPDVPPSPPAPSTRRPRTGLVPTALPLEQEPRAADNSPVSVPGPRAAAALSFTDLASPDGLGSTLRLSLLVGVLSLAPAILLMTTCYVRIIIVLGLLRQALGVQQFPPTQVLTALSLFLTALVMYPTWERCYHAGVEPYAEATALRPATEADLRLALARTAGPLRNFMSQQIELTGNGDSIDLLMSYHTRDAAPAPMATYYEDVPLQVLLPAYVLSELKTAFLIGFQVYLPFVVIDLVVTSVLATLGLGMLSPAVVSLPFKLLLFVMIDGWFLTVEMLLKGFGG